MTLTVLVGGEAVEPGEDARSWSHPEILSRCFGYPIWTVYVSLQEGLEIEVGHRFVRDHCRGDGRPTSSRLSPGSEGAGEPLASSNATKSEAYLFRGLEYFS